MIEEFEFLRREVAGKELLKGSLHFTGQCEAGLLPQGRPLDCMSSLLTLLVTETIQTRVATWAVLVGGGELGS